MTQSWFAGLLECRNAVFIPCIIAWPCSHSLSVSFRLHSRQLMLCQNLKTSLLGRKPRYGRRQIPAATLKSSWIERASGRCCVSARRIFLQFPSLPRCSLLRPSVRPGGVPHIVLACPAEIIAENPYLSLPATESSCYHKYQDPFFNFSSRHNLLKYGTISYIMSAPHRERGRSDIC